MTFQNIVNRIRTISLAHKQVRYFRKGLVQDFLTDKTIPYPAVFLQDNGGSINPRGNVATFSFRLFFLDLVHVSQDTNENELDVLSDMVSVALDIIAQLNYPAYTDWKLSDTNALQLIVENDGDMNAGAYVDIVISIPYEQDVCAVPTTIPGYEPGPNDDDMKLVYDIKYTATGSEGKALTVPEIAGKKLLLVTREYSPLYRVSNLPAGSEFTWNDTVIGLGLPTMPGERFLILYRTY